MKRQFAIWIMVLAAFLCVAQESGLQKLQFDQSVIGPHFTKPDMPLITLPAMNLNRPLAADLPTITQLSLGYNTIDLADSLGAYQLDWRERRL